MSMVDFIQNSSIYSPSFQGHFGAEKTCKKGFTWLIHETGFFRDKQTNEFVKNYITNTFYNSDKIRIISGGCSTGEEAVTYSMLLNSIKDKIEILGFDVSEQSISRAKSRKYLMQKPKEYNPDDLLVTAPTCSAFDDAFLWTSNVKNLSEKEREYRNLFQEFFEPCENPNSHKKISFFARIKNLLKDALSNPFPFEIESKLFKLKEGKASNCEFIEGDIMDINNIVSDKSANVILFRNALYHIITNNVESGSFRRLKINAEEIIENLGQNIRRSLCPKGILVFGRNEEQQFFNSEIVPSVMLRLGFKPLNQTNEHLANVWQKL